MNTKPILSLVLFFSFLGSTFAQSVGTTEGVFNVSDMGAVNYSIPIKVPDGVGGLQPNIAISYNSQGGNGPLGMGWSISGLSSITRTGNTIYHDSKVNAVTLGGGDRFALDGNRLILTSGSTYGAANTGYNTEIETFIQITANGVLGGGPLSFTVKDQNGLTYEYGGTGAYVIAQGSTTPYKWLLKKVSDLNGNFMTISYYIYDGVAFPNEIAYNQNSNTSAAPKNFVKFIYAGSMDFDAFGYLAGGKISSYTVLEAIKVIYNGGQERIYRSYSLDYETDFYPHLKTVTEKGADEIETLNPTQFTYGSVAQNNVMTSKSILQNVTSTRGECIGDYNGDGLSDLIDYPVSNGGNFNLYLRNQSGSYTNAQTGTIENGFSGYAVDNLIEYNQSLSIPFDYNGDGKSDFTCNQNYVTGGTQQQRYWIYVSNGSSIVNTDPIVRHDVPSAPNPKVFSYTRPFLGDFDGDGKTEILLLNTLLQANAPNGQPNPANFLIGEKYNTYTTALGYPAYKARSLGVNFGFDASYMASGESKLFVIDSDGDGKNEILSLWHDNASNTDHTQIFRLNVTFDANNNPVIGSPVFIQVGDGNFPGLNDKLFFGDFNGDRITDALVEKPLGTGSFWFMGYGNGAGIFVPMLPPSGITVSNGNGGYTRPLLIADFNGDGMDDIFDYAPAGASNGTVYGPRIHFSKGNNSFVTEQQSMDQSVIGIGLSGYKLGDFNGDGNIDFITRISYSSTPYECNFHPNETRHLLSKVTNGLGAYTKLNYMSLTNSLVYLSGNNTYTYPYVKKAIPLKVVYSTVSDNGMPYNNENTTAYTYTGFKFNMHGKGLMGFEKITSYDFATQTSFEKNFSLNTAYAFPYLESTNTRISLTTLRTSYNTYGIYDYGNKRIFQYPVTSTQGNALTGEISTTTNTYSFPGWVVAVGEVYSSDIGKPFSVTTNKGNGLETTVQSFVYPSSTNTPSYVYSRPSKITTTNTRQYQPSYTRAVTFAYDATFGYLNQSISDPGTSNEVVNGAYYDVYGNPFIKYTTAAGLSPQSEVMTYDPSHRYVTETYSFAFPNIKSKATYDGLTGTRLTETAPDGFKTTYTYDAFDRVKTVSDDNGVSATTSYTWGYSLPGDIVSWVAAVYYTTTTSNTGTLNYVLHDCLGREIRSKTKNFQSQLVTTNTGYNNKGQVVSVSKPAFGNNSAQNVTTVYDIYGRPTTISAPAGNTTYSYLYQATYPLGTGTYTVTETNPAGLQTQTITDRSGRKTQAKDAQNNNLIYNYHSNGNIKEVISGSTMLQTYNYDAFNRLIERWDPNYGIYQYTYNAYGQTLSQTDPKSQTYTFKYDAMGRMYQKTGPEGDYFYDYSNNTGVNCGKMTLLTGPEGKINYVYGLGNKIEAIGYDDNGFAMEITGNALSNSQVKTFAYDNFGRLQKQGHWPTNTTLWYEYGANGDLTQIINHNTNTVLYEKTGENASGQITSYRQTNSNSGYELNTDIAYDSYNLLTRQTSFDNVNTLRDMKYSFEATSGNLLNRKDNKYGLGESFSYDNLNRLESIANSNNSALDISMQFNTNGNIEKKTDVGGNFEYDPANRVSTINLDPNVPSNIPTATQQLTYTPFDKVKTIDEGSYHTEFHYWPDGSRSMMEVTNNDAGEQSYKIYIPDVETKYDIMSGQKTAYTYVNSPEGNMVGMIVNDFSSDIDYFVLTDHLGSITQIVDETGNILEEKSFDAWGRLRNPQTWEPYPSNLDAGQPAQLFDRGYTGHEHLACYGIINMNGRLYDPVMGRMFSPDINIVGGGSLQGYNRYSYAMNNPLKYTDPDGNMPIVALMAIGAGINALMYMNSHVQNGTDWNWLDFTYSAGTGAIFGAIAYGAGGTTSFLGNVGFIAGFANGAASGGVGGFLGGINSGMINGSNNPFMDGLKGAGWGAAVGGIINGTISGFDAVIHHGNFFTGIGATYEFGAGMQIEGGSDAVEYSTASAKEFSSQYIGENPKGLNNLYADGSVPDGYVLDGDYALGGGEGQAQGVTTYLGRGKSDVYLYKAAFSSREQLYLVMRHEYMHVTFNNLGLMNYNKQEASARLWMLNQGKAWGYKVDALQGAFNDMSNFLGPRYSYYKLGIPILKSKPW